MLNSLELVTKRPQMTIPDLGFFIFFLQILGSEEVVQIN